MSDSISVPVISTLDPVEQLGVLQQKSREKRGHALPFTFATSINDSRDSEDGKAPGGTAPKIRTMKSPAACALFVLLALALQAQVRTSLMVEAVVLPVKLGDKLTAKLAIEIAPGWHIASTTQPEGGPVRTEIALAKGQPFKLAGPITGPKPHVEHSTAFDLNVETYTGTVVFTLPLIATEEIKPGTKLTVEITYQACNDETCRLPKTDKVSCIMGEPMSAADKAKPLAEKNQ